MLLEPDTDYDMDLYFYWGCGVEEKRVQFLPSLVWLDEKIEKLYYDLKVALDAARCLPVHDGTVTLPVRGFEIVSLKCRFNH